MSASIVTELLHYVGVQDPGLRVFDIIMESPYGTSYNSYVVKGSEKTVLFETVKRPFFDKFLENLKEVTPLDRVDYIVCQHTEPDHSGSYEALLRLCPNAQVLASATAISFLKEIINAPFPHRIVTEADRIDLGGLTLTFLSVPMLHWPDSIYTYIPELKALFTCDSFGCHYSDERVFNDLIQGDFEGAYRYYFDNIIGPYARPHMQNALKKLDELDIQFICNGHGPVIRSDPQKYIEMYRRWSAPAPKSADPRVVIAYVSAYGYTRALGEAIVEGMAQAGIARVELYDLVACDIAKARAAVAESDAFLLGSPTLVGDALPPVWEMLIGLNPIIHRGKPAGAFGSYAWSGEAVPNLMARMEQLKLRLPVPGLRVKLKPSAEQLDQARQYGREFAEAVLHPGPDKPKDAKPAPKRWKCAVCGQIFTGERPPAPCPVCGAGADAFVALPDAPAAGFRRDTLDRFVIIGGGAAGLEAAKAIRARNAGCTIQLIAGEGLIPYNRPVLSDALADGTGFDGLALEPFEYYRRANIELITWARAASVDAAGKRVMLSDGRALPYDKLLLATGANPFNPLPRAEGAIPCFTLRSYADVMDIEPRCAGARAIVVGGGILGLEAALALRERGAQVAIFELGERALPLQADAPASRMIADALAKLGISIRTGISVKQFTATGAELTNVSTVEADFALASIGVRSEVSLAKAMGLTLNRGVVVDEYMRTSLDDVFATGDCAEFHGRVAGLWAAAVRQGQVAGAAMCGDLSAPCAPIVPATSLEAGGIALFSVGALQGDEHLTHADEQAGTYRRLYFADGALCGAIFVNDARGAARAVELIGAAAPRAEAAALL